MKQTFPLVGLAREQERLADALRKHRPLLLLGPAGSGKSALIQAALANLPASNDIVQLRYSPNLHRLLMDLADSLFRTRHRTFRKLVGTHCDIEKWLAQQTSVHLKGILWTSLEAEPRTIVLDGIEGASFPMYRFIQRLYFAKGMAFLAAARDPVSLGILGRLFWDPRITVHLRPLNRAESGRLFDLAADRFRLSDLNLEDFREKVLEAAAGNPGQIMEMCHMASNPMYVSGRHIKFAPLRIDVLMKFV